MLSLADFVLRVYNIKMYTSGHKRGYLSRTELAKSKSADNFYLKAAERSLKYQPTQPNKDGDCLACQHEQKLGGLSARTGFGVKNVYTTRQSTEEEYYKTSQKGQKDELTHLRKSKRYLE
jgi:hypothetical protein